MLRRFFRVGDHGRGLRFAGLLCKLFFRHHFHFKTLSRPEISFRAEFRHSGNTLRRKKSQRKNTVTHRKTGYGTSFFRQSLRRSVRPFRAVFGTEDTIASSLRYHHHKLYSQTGRSKIILFFHTFHPWYSTQKQYLYRHGIPNRAAFFVVRFFRISDHSK